MPQSPTGRFLRANIVAADLSTFQELSWVNKNNAAVTLVANQRLILKTIVFANAATAKRVTFFQDADADNAVDSGEEVIVLESGGVESYCLDFGQGIPLAQINAAVTNNLHVLSSAAGAVSLTVLAEVVDT